MGLNIILICTVLILGVSLYLNLFLLYRNKNTKKDIKNDELKVSEKLKIKAQNEENDIKSFALMCKALREERNEKFVNGWLTPLKLKYKVEHRKNGSYTITTIKYGAIDYFPKANKLLIRKLNSWQKPGLKWIIKNLLNDNR